MESGEAYTERVARTCRRRLWLERAVFLAVVALGLGYYFVVVRGVGGACLILLDSRPVVVVRNRAVAHRVLDGIKQSAGDLPDVAFLQQVTLRPVSGEGNPIVSDVEALRLLLSRLTPVVKGVGVFANDQLIVGLPNRQEAVSALSRLLTELSPRGPEVTRAFRERVRVAETQIPVRLYLDSADRVMEKVREMTAPRGTHAVQRGDTAWKISRIYHVSLDALAYANPGVDLGRLHEEDRLTIPGGAPPVSVIARREIEETVAPGKTQTVRITYLNGRETERAVVRRSRREEPSRPAPRRRSVRRRPRAPGRRSESQGIAPAQDSTGQEIGQPPQENGGDGPTDPQEPAETP